MTIVIDGAVAKGWGLRTYRVIVLSRVHGWLLRRSRGRERCYLLGGTRVHADLVMVNLMQGHLLWGILAYGSGGEARPRDEMSSINDCIPRGYSWREKIGVIESDASGDCVVGEGGVKHGINRACDVGWHVMWWWMGRCLERIKGPQST
jgi:hypothetical protein